MATFTCGGSGNTSPMSTVSSPACVFMYGANSSEKKDNNIQHHSGSRWTVHRTDVGRPATSSSGGTKKRKPFLSLVSLQCLTDGIHRVLETAGGAELSESQTVNELSSTIAKLRVLLPGSKYEIYWKLFYTSFVANLVLYSTVKEFGKSIKIIDKILTSSWSPTAPFF